MRTGEATTPGYLTTTTTAERAIATIGEKYRVEQVLGSGGMGTVYACINTWTGRRVAIKLLRPELSAVPAIVKRFMQEAQASTRIRHPHIVDVLDMGRDEPTGSLYIVQSFLEGEDLGEWMRTHRRMSPREAFQLMIPVMEAIAAAHDAGIVHRDIKPENIFLSRGEHGEVVPVVIDFGISKVVVRDASDRMTNHGVAIGTPEYMSPEQAAGEEDLDGRTDVWSLGVVLYELLCSAVPFVARNYNLTILRVLTEPVPRIETLTTGLPESAIRIVHRALERDRSARYATVREMLHDVRASGDLAIEAISTPRVRVNLSSPANTVCATAPRTGDGSPDGACDRPTADELPRTDPFETAQPAALRPPPRAFAIALCLVLAVFASHAAARGEPAVMTNAGAKAARQLTSLAISRPGSPIVPLLSPPRDVDSPTAETRAVNPSSARPPSPATRPMLARAVLPWAQSRSARDTRPLAHPTRVSPSRNSGALDVVRRHHIVVE